MPVLSRVVARRPRRVGVTACLVVAATSAFSAAALVGLALAKTFTLEVAKNAPVTNVSGKTVHENIVVNSRRFAVYTLSGDSAKHPKCTKANGCFGFWPPVKVGSGKHASRAPGITGKLGIWRRDGFRQLTLNGHPLYTFAEDSQKGDATGQGIHTFGGTWHVVRAASTSMNSAPSPPSSPPMSSPTPPGY